MAVVRVPATTYSVSQGMKVVQYGWNYCEMADDDANRQVYLTRRGCKLHTSTNCLGERDVVETLTYAQAIERGVKHCKCCFGKWSQPVMTLLRTERLPDYRPS